MLKKVTFLLFVLVISFGSARAAGTCDAETNNCGTGEYCKSTQNMDNTISYVCTMCTTKPDNAQYTGSGGRSDACPWKMTCQNKPDFQNGTWAPDVTEITYNGTGTVPACTYDLKKITCNTTGNSTCSNLGFHLDGESCVSNVQSCENNGYKFYTNNTWSDCYVSSCASDETLIPKETCGTTLYVYGICKPKGIDCNSASAQTAGLTASACSGGTISGTATLNGTTYDISQCACEKTSTQISNGTAGEKCFYNGTSNKFDTGCTYTVNACNAGYCSTDSQTCVSVPAGYYSTGTEKECRKCPAGATSAAGSTAKTACHYTSTTTFADSVGNFTLPASGNIEIKWNWQ